MQCQLRNGTTAVGGALGYPSTELFEEVAYVAYHFHWPHSELMNLEHVERRLWVKEIVKINERLNAAGQEEDEHR